MKYAGNIPKVLVINMLWAFMVIMPVIVPFFESLGLNMGQIYLLQAIFGGATLILEVPSGYISDLWGRKASLIIASVCNGIGFTIFTVSTDFYDLVVAELILALGLSLFSGTDISIIYDSLLADGSKKAPIKLVGRKVFYRQVGETLGGLFGGWMVLISLNAAAYLNAVVQWLPLIAVLTIVEPPRKKMEKKKHKENILYIYRSLFRHSTLLNLIIFNTIFYSVSTLIAVWTFQKYWDEIHIPLIYFGYLWAFCNFVVAIVARYAHKIEKAIGSSVALTLIGLAPIAGYLGMGLVDATWGFLFCLFFQGARGLNSVILADALNKRVSSDMRATANSISGLGVRAIFMVTGPVVGYAIDDHGVSSPMLYLAYAYVGIFLFLMVPFLFQRKNFAPIKK